MSGMTAYKPSFRIAHDYLERQLDKLPAYASAETYWQQAWADLLKTGEGRDVFAQELLAAAYWELERVWLSQHAESVSV